MAAVLVTYATKYGSTREAAEAIATRLRSRGIPAETCAANDARGLEGYSAVVLGTALYFFQWRGEAHRFVRRNKKALAEKPMALFGIGPMEDTPEQFTGAREHLDKGLAKHAWLHPRAITVFGGRFDPSGLRFPDNLPAVRAMARADLLDLAAVSDWADSLVGALGLSADPASTAT